MEPVVAKQAKPAASSTAIAAVQATSAVSATNIAAQDGEFRMVGLILHGRSHSYLRHCF
jgi:hypothetical protein